MGIVRALPYWQLTFLLSAVDTGLDCMEDVHDVIELVGESADRAGLCIACPSPSADPWK